MSETAAIPTGNPFVIGLPSFLVGAIALGLVLTGFAPATATGASIPLIMTATGLGLVFAARWAAQLGQNAVAGVFAIFSGFWISYAALFLGLTHNWFGIVAEDVAKTQEVFLISWLVVIGLLTLGTLRLPGVYTLLFVLVEIALLLLLWGIVGSSATLVKASGFSVFAFCLVGAYLFVGNISTETGGKPLPLGKPMIR